MTDLNALAERLEKRRIGAMAVGRDLVQVPEKEIVEIAQALRGMGEALEIASDVMSSQAGLLEMDSFFAPGVAAALNLASADARSALKGRDGLE